MLVKSGFDAIHKYFNDTDEIITKEGEEINRYKASEETGKQGKAGKRVGTAYQLENGEIIYIPE